MHIIEAQQCFTLAQQIAHHFQLTRLEQKISMEHDNLLEKLDFWNELKERNAPLSERLRLVSFVTDLKLLMKKKEIEQVEIVPEEPQLLSIISKSGRCQAGGRLFAVRTSQFVVIFACRHRWKLLQSS